MFDRLGKSISRHPKRFVAAWLVIMLAGSLAALWGFGEGSIFTRMASSESFVPGTESDDVLEKTTEADGPATIVTITGAEPSQVETELNDLHSQLDGVAGLKILDPASITDEFEAGKQEAIDSAVAQAVQDNQDAVDAAIQAAIADHQAEIEQAAQLAAMQFAAQNPGVPTDQVEQAARDQATAQISDAAREAAQEQIEQTARQQATEEADKTENPADEFVSDSGFVVAATLDSPSPDEQNVQAATEDFAKSVEANVPGSTASVVNNEIMKDLILDQVKVDLIHGEAIGLPIALLLMMIVFGGLIAAGLPLMGAITSILIGMGGLWVLTRVTNVDTFVLNIISIIGLALSIDYGLLIVSRYREEIAGLLEKAGLKPAEVTKEQADDLISEAVATSVATAGRTVSFSALTIAFAISGLLVMAAPMLRMISYGGIIVTILAVATAVTMVPSVIRLLGVRLIHPSVLTRIPLARALFRGVGDSTSDVGFFSRLAGWVHARPIRILIVVSALLIVFAAPIRGLNMRSNFVEYVPEDSGAYTAYHEMQDYKPFTTPSGSVIAEVAPDETQNLQDFISSQDGVEWISDPEELAPGETLINFYMDAADPVGPEVTQTVKDIRAYDAGYDVSVGGAAALQLDFNESLLDGAAISAIVVVLAVLILLFLLTGSVIAPLTALVVNTLSLVAGLGATVFVFRHGLFGLPQTNGLETFVVATAVAFGFGLAMDYEVFLLARIKEYWDQGNDNDTAVEKGLQRSGRIITSAAAIIIAVFIGFMFGNIVAIKQIGVALALIVVIDASLVRMLLVPAFMTLLGRWNWWAPKPLRKVYEKFKLVH